MLFHKIKQNQDKFRDATTKDAIVANQISKDTDKMSHQSPIKIDNVIK